MLAFISSRSSWALAFLIPSLHAWATFLYLSQAHPCFHFVCLWALSGLSPSSMPAFYHACWTFCTLEWTVLVFWGRYAWRSTISPLQAISHVFLLSRSLSKPQSPVLRSRVVTLLFVLHSSQYLKLYQLLVTVAELTISFQLPDEFFLVHQWQVQQSTIPSWLIDHFREEIICYTLQKSPGLLVPSPVAFPSDTGVVKVPHDHQGLRSWGFIQLSKEGFHLLALLDQAACSR